MSGGGASVHLTLGPIHKLDQLILPDSGYVIDTPATPLGYCYINNLNLSDDKVYSPNLPIVSYVVKETLAMSKLVHLNFFSYPIY
jgi:hypothetical protein